MADGSKTKQSIRYISSKNQGMLEMRFLDKIAGIWREENNSLPKETQDEILRFWQMDLISLNISYLRWKEVLK